MSGALTQLQASKADGRGLPQQQYQHRSHRHLGTCSFDIGSRTPKAIIGVYFTDRYTKGDMRLTLVDRTTSHGSYEEAQSHAAGVTS